MLTKRPAVGFLVLALAGIAGPALRAAGGNGRIEGQVTRPDGTPVGGVTARLLWFASTPEEGEAGGESPSEAVNPASIVKLATTLWALERLGPAHRFTTRVALRGELDPSSGLVEGDLVVVGGGDPDFHVENGYLLARELNRIGVRAVTGALVVDRRFWIGWEGGSERRIADEAARAREMARRLRDALDPDRWDDADRRSIDELRARRSIEGESLPRVRRPRRAGVLRLRRAR